MSENKPPGKTRKFKFKKILATALVSMAIFLMGYVAGTSGLLVNNQLGSLNDLPEDLDYTSVEQVYDSLRQNYDGELNANELLDGMKQGLAQASGDPYTEYLNAQEAEAFDEQLSGSFTGIGAELGKENELITIVAPLEGFPAEKAGLRPKDVITKIDGENAFNISITEAVQKIRGPKGEKVTLTIIRNETEELEIEIVRDEIKIPSVTSEILADYIGYLKVTRFGNDTADLARKAANSFKSQDVEGVILDLRSNPGGLLDASVALASLWVNPGEIVLEEKRGGESLQVFRASGGAVLHGVPTVVLINEGSASASEITAGALKDHDLATLVGAKTYGKGSVQQLINFRNDTVLKVTIARWFTPGGQNIDQEGITPDETIERTNEDFEQERDPQKDKALELLRASN